MPRSGRRPCRLRTLVASSSKRANRKRRCSVRDCHAPTPLGCRRTSRRRRRGGDHCRGGAELRGGGHFLRADRPARAAAVRIAGLRSGCALGSGAEMVAPRYMPLIGYAEAWSPPTKGILTGTPIFIGDSSVAEIDAASAGLRGAIASRTGRKRSSCARTGCSRQWSARPVRTGDPPLPTPAERHAHTTDACAGFGRTGQESFSGPERWSTAPCACKAIAKRLTEQCPPWCSPAEHYNMLVRLRAGRMRRSSSASRSALAFVPRIWNSYNVWRRIPGTDPQLRDEVVLVGAHLDSWHTATGATDNADGVAATMEAMRILAALKSQPRRTIRVALWGGEEQGLLGARAYSHRRLQDCGCAFPDRRIPERRSRNGPDLRLLHGGECGREGDFRYVARAAS